MSEPTDSEPFVPNPLITKQVMEEYEKVRQSGKSNMFDIHGVVQACLDLKCHELMNIFGKDWMSGTLYSTQQSLYIEILRNFNKYMKLYDIKQS